MRAARDYLGLANESPAEDDVWAPVGRSEKRRIIAIALAAGAIVFAITFPLLRDVAGIGFILPWLLALLTVNIAMRAGRGRAHRGGDAT